MNINRRITRGKRAIQFATKTTNMIYTINNSFYSTIRNVTMCISSNAPNIIISIDIYY